MDYLDKLQSDLNAIAAEPEGQVVPTPPDWRQTRIAGWNGFSAEAARIQNPRWFDKPTSAAEANLNALLERAGLGKLRDGKEGRIEARVEVEEVVQAQHEKQKAGVEDEGEEWRSYLPESGDDARAWLSDLSTRIDMNARSNKGFFGALTTHVESKGKDAKCADLNPQLIEICLRALCAV
jgi:hypothetical protein